ncbi:MAG: hypothetical protein H6719_08030 [Sandaracinaceae bacterium]|nr:hypothetical protein [Sandaracinaceae bacterium]
MTRTLSSSILAAALLAACGPDAQLDRTLATVERVRGEATLEESTVERVGRVAPSQALTIGDGGLTRLSLDSGPWGLLDAAARVTIVDEATIALEAGRMYAEAGEGEELFVTAGERSIRVSDASVSATLEGDLAVYVVRGEVSWTAGEARGIARAGEQLTLGSEPATTPVTLWRDWTGGLARPGPSDARGPEGVGVLEARVPDEIGQARWPLVIRRLDVQVRIVGDLAVTEVEQVFFNPASEMVEGLYRIRVPEEAVLQRFAVDRDGHMVDGYVREKAQAQAAYQAQVYRGSQLDPALLEWVAPGRYRARIYPIRPGETRRIVVRYAEWLAPIAEGGPRLYRYPMGGGRDAPRVQELSVAVDVEEAEVERLRAGMGAAVEGGRVRLRRSDFAPRSDFWLELYGSPQGQRAWRAPHEPPPRAPDARTVVGEADERDYFYLPLHLPERLFADARATGVDLVIVADVSAGTDRSHLELGRSVAEAISAHLGANDRVAIVTSDLTIRSLGDGPLELGDASPDRVEALLDGLARVPAGGATDLGAAIAAAAGLLDPARPGAVIYVGDGAPTVGELEAEGLLERIARLPAPLRLYAVGVGGDANLDLLESLTRGGGLALRVEERSAAADAALRLLGHVTRPVAQRVTVALGDGIENVYPRRPVDVVEGEILSVSGRIRDALPTTVHVHGTISGTDFDEDIPVATLPTEQSTDLRLRWAGERLRQLLLEGAGREEVAELGVRYGLITPFSSYYVPSAAELNGYGPLGLRWIDQPDLLQQVDLERRASRSGLDAIFAVALGPLAIAGCAGGDDEPAAVSSAMQEAQGWAGDPAPEVAEEEAMPVEAPVVVAEPMAPPPAQPATSTPMPTSGSTATVTGAPGGSPPADAFGGDDGIVDQLQRLGYAPGPARPATRSREAGGEVMDPWAGSEDVLAAAEGVGAGGGGQGYGQAAQQNERRARVVERNVRPNLALRLGGRADQADDNSNADRRTSANAAIDLDEVLGGLASPDDDGERSHRDANGYFTTVVTVRTTTERAAQHEVRRCSDASRLSLADREELWRERLGAAGGPSGWVGVYRTAIRECEAPSWRDRRTLLSAILGSAGSVDRMISVYHLFSTGSERGFLRGAILARVRSPQDLRSVRGAFGLGNEPDWELVEQVLERAANEAARVRALRRLSMQYPDSFDLKLRLLEALETGGHGAEARRLADHLRTDARSDAGVRTAVGEMYLRMGQEEEARRVFSEIVEFAPLDELARRRLGDLYRAHGWFEDAYRQYQTLASIRPDDPTALLLLAQAAAGTGRIDEALRLEQRLMETAQPGAEQGIARIAQLWTSVRLAKLRAAAREANDEERLGALDRRVRRSGVLGVAGDLRATLVWSHPDAQIGLWAAHPNDGLARPAEIAPEFGIEAFDVPEQDDGTYRFEVRRADASSPTDMAAELVLVWHEGREDEVVEVVPLDFSGGRAAYAWTLTGSALTEARR